MIFNRGQAGINKGHFRIVHQKGNVVMALLIVALLVLGVSFFVPSMTSTSELKAEVKAAVDAKNALANSNNSENPGEGKVLGSTSISPGENSEGEKLVTHVLPPKAVKAVYMTSWVAGTPKLRNKIIDLIDKTELNAVVIDIKDDTGKVSFVTNSPVVNDVGCTENRIRDIGPLLKELHDKNIYVIGRIATFQDPCLVKKHPDSAVKRKSDGGIWKDRKGLTWMDAGAEYVWDYNINIARASHELGFDEINFDYIRYPTDGNMSDISFPVSGTRAKADTLGVFFKHIDKELRGGRASSSSDPVFDELVKEYGMDLGTTSASLADTSHDGQRVETTIYDMPRPIISADLFGLVTNNTDDMGIGQVLIRAAPYVDFIGPMVYPSHYPNTFIGYKNPAAYPYQIVSHAMKGGVKQLRGIGLNPIKLRPWLQDFNLGATYTADMVRKQIQATYDSGLTSWMIWDASNTYTVGGALNIREFVAAE